MGKATAAKATIRVQTHDRRTLSRVLRPSVMTAFSGAEANERLLSLPGPIGAVRDGYAWDLMWAPTREEFMERARAIYRSILRPFAERGALVLAGFCGTPRWLADDPNDAAPVAGSGWPAYATRPPRDFAAYAELAADLVRMANDPRVVIEFANEPAASVFWAGTEAQLFELFALTSAAVRGAGGQIIGMANSPPTDGFLERWIATRPMTNGISWHLFQGHPRDGIEAVEKVRGWLRAAGMDENLPQVVTEWTRWPTWPANDPARDTVVGQAYHIAALDQMARAGIYAATYANLAGFGPSEIGDGDFGLMARGADGILREKPAYEVLRGLARLGDQEFGVTVAPALAKLGVGALAGVSRECGSSVTALLWRYDETPGASPVEIDVRWPGLRRGIALAPFDFQVVAD